MAPIQTSRQRFGAADFLPASQVAEVPLVARDVCLWHEAGIKQRPLFGRYGVESGHHRLIVSISAYDPKRTSPMLFGEYSLHEPRRGRDDIEAFMTDFRKAAPDSNFWAPRT
ncbi:MAG: hypothetical protein WBL84_21985 [Xanthobacteraceae bacterium]